MPWDFSLGNSVGQLLQLEYLEIHALAFVRDDKIRVQWAFWATRLFTKNKYTSKVIVHIYLLLNTYQHNRLRNQIIKLFVYLRVTFSGHDISFKPRFHSQVWNDVLTRATLDGNLCCLGFDSRNADDDSRDFYQMGHDIRLKFHKGTTISAKKQKNGYILLTPSGLNKWSQTKA